MSTQIPFGELPYHELVEVDISTLDDAQVREYLRVLQEQRTSPQKRKSVAKKASKKLTGKTIDISKLL